MASEQPLPFVYQFMAGAVAGVSEILVMYPLDVVKTRVYDLSKRVRATVFVAVLTGDRRQIQGRVPIPGQDHYNSMVDCFRKIIANEG